MSKRERWIVAAAVIAVAATSLPWALPMLWRTAVAPKEESAAARGRMAAERLGCFSCHGAGGTGGVPDPGSPDPVPALTAGVPWQYASDVRELENWILDGDPKGRGEIRRQHGREKHPTASPTATSTSRDHEDSHAHGTAPPTSDGETAHEHTGLMKMPAFRDHVDSQTLSDLIAFIVALSPREKPTDEAVLRGLEIASRNGCFACHGPMGSGGISNPGSFKGYIPGFFGNDLRELATNSKEIESWIRDGNVQRLERNPAAKFFLDRQPIKMPAYEKTLRDAEVADLVAMIEWIHEAAR